MKTVYETLDGKVFHDAHEAEKHENEILSCVNMWNWEKERTTDTSQARVVHLVGDDAGAYFKAMMRANPKEDWGDCDIDSWFDDEDTGWFYWDEYAETYRHIDSQIVDLLIRANHEI